MKNQAKKLLATILIISITLTNGLLVCGADSLKDKRIGGSVETGVSPLYVNTSGVTAALTISSGTATCKGTNIMTVNKESKITLRLQRSTDGETYSLVEAWNQTYTGIGTKILTKTTSLTKGYYYRLRVVVRVYENGKVVEKIIKYSSVVKY